MIESTSGVKINSKWHLLRSRRGFRKALLGTSIAITLGVVTGLLSQILQSRLNESAYTELIGLSSNEDGTATMLRSPISLSGVYELHADYDDDGFKEWNVVEANMGKWNEFSFRGRYSPQDSDSYQTSLIEVGNRVRLGLYDSDRDGEIDVSQFFIVDANNGGERSYADKNLDGIVDTLRTLDESSQTKEMSVLVGLKWVRVREVLTDIVVLCDVEGATRKAELGDAGWVYR